MSEREQKVAQALRHLAAEITDVYAQMEGLRRRVAQLEQLARDFESGRYGPLVEMAVRDGQTAITDPT